MTARAISIIAGLFLLILGTFFAGMWTTHQNWWPWQTVEEGRKLLHSYRATGKFLRDGTYTKRKDYVPDAFYTVYDQAAMAKGYLVINRFHPTEQRFVTDLIDGEGKIIHTWPIDFTKIDPKGDPLEFIHIATALPDGSLLVDFDDARGMARLDACGNPIWTKTDMVYHHSIEAADDGYWTWADGNWEGGQDQRMVRFDPMTGETLESIDLAKDVAARSPADATALTIPEGFVFNPKATSGVDVDILHPNDVEALTAAMAPAFPQFKAGDILISLRNINLLAVIDRHTHAILWAQYGPWKDQHDADFNPDGTISVFSNNIDRNRSTIISIDPKTNKSRDLFYGTGVTFESYIMGKHQRLPNGNWLITAPIQGRVIEVTSEGRMVREVNNVIDQTFNSIVTYGEFKPEGFFTTLPTCQK
jgi:hypothetical protein